MPEKDTLDLKAMAQLTVLCMLWGFNGVAIKVGNAGIAPVSWTECIARLVRLDRSAEAVIDRG